MGLDISLYRFDIDIDAYVVMEEEVERRLNEFYKNWPQGTWQLEEFKAAHKKHLEKEEGRIGWALSEYGEIIGCKTEVNEPSALHPDHLFKIGYLRSSYNSGGFNSVMRVQGVPDLYSVFEPDDERYVQPDWEKARERAVEGRKMWLEVEPLRVLRENFIKPSDMPNAQPVTEEEAVAAVREKQRQRAALTEEQRQERELFGAMFSNWQGFFAPGGWTVDVRGLFIGRGMFGPEAMLVYAVSDEERDHYTQSWDIIIENIEYVLGQDEPSRYALGWSA